MYILYLQLSNIPIFLTPKITDYASYQFHRKCICCRKTLKAFREGKVDVLVATDAFARGMDVVGVGSVINYDMPTFTKTYVHRAGRTARADQTGRCFTLMSKSQVRNYFFLAT